MKKKTRTARIFEDDLALVQEIQREALVNQQQAIRLALRKNKLPGFTKRKKKNVFI